MGGTCPTFYSQIYNAAYVIIKPLKYIFWKLSNYIHIILKCVYEELFIKYVSKFAVIKKKRRKYMMLLNIVDHKMALSLMDLNMGE